MRQWPIHPSGLSRLSGSGTVLRSSRPRPGPVASRVGPPRRFPVALAACLTRRKRHVSAAGWWSNALQLPGPGSVDWMDGSCMPLGRISISCGPWTWGSEMLCSQSSNDFGLVQFLSYSLYSRCIEYLTYA